jgi:hypothetical protein
MGIASKEDLQADEQIRLQAPATTLYRGCTVSVQLAYSRGGVQAGKGIHWQARQGAYCTYYCTDSGGGLDGGDGPQPDCAALRCTRCTA